MKTRLTRSSFIKVLSLGFFATRPKEIDAQQLGRSQIVGAIFDRNLYQLEFGLQRIKTNDSIAKSALLAAIKTDFLEALQVLLDAGVDPNQSIDGHTPIQVAVMAGSKGTLQILLDHGAGPNHQSQPPGQTPLELAIQNNNVHVARLLLNHGADLYHRDRFGLTPVHFAAFDPEMITLFKSYRADLAVRSGDGLTPLMWLARHRLSEPRCDPSRASALVHEFRPTLSARDDHGRTPLIFAALAGDDVLVAQLLDLKADPNVRDLDGNNALTVVRQRRAAFSRPLLMFISLFSGDLRSQAVSFERTERLLASATKS